MSITLCPPPDTEPAPVRPSADNLSYSLGLPGGAYCAGLARGTVRNLLQEHGLGDYVSLGELAVSELLACAYRFTPDQDVSLSLRYRYETLRVTVFDRHPVHVDHDAAQDCREQRLGRSGYLLPLPNAAVASGASRTLKHRSQAPSCGLHSRWKARAAMRSCDAQEILYALQRQLERHQIVPPSLRIEQVCTGDEMVNLGGVHPDVVGRLVEVLRESGGSSAGGSTIRS